MASVNGVPLCTRQPARSASATKARGSAHGSVESAEVYTWWSPTSVTQTWPSSVTVMPCGMLNVSAPNRDSTVPVAASTRRMVSCAPTAAWYRQSSNPATIYALWLIIESYHCGLINTTPYCTSLMSVLSIMPLLPLKVFASHTRDPLHGQ